MSVLATDNFNRSDGAAGANWTTVDHFSGGAGMVIDSNNLRGNGATWCFGYYSGVATPDQHHYSQVLAPTSGLYYGPAVRCSGTDGSTANWVGWHNNGEIWKSVNGITTQIGTAATFTTNDIVKLEANGTSYTPYKNGVAGTPVTDSSLSGGTFGVFAYSVSGRFDDFEGGDYGVGGGVNTNLFFRRRR